MKKTTFNFTGTLKTIQPITVTLPGVDGLPRNGHKKTGAEPYFPASSIRGALRHAAHREALRYTKKKEGVEVPFTVDEHFMLAQGIDTTGLLTNPKDKVDANRIVREKNPLLSVFGRWGLESKLDMGNAFPTEDGSWGVFGNGARGVMFEREEDLVDELSDEGQKQLKDILIEQSKSSISLSEMKKEISELKKQARQYRNKGDNEEEAACYDKVKEIEDSMKKLKDEKAGPRESIRRPLDGFEAFAANTELTHRLILKGATPEELGFFLKSLSQFARKPLLGGHQASGCGLVEFEWNVTAWLDDDSLTPSSVGYVKVGIDGIEIEGELLTDAIKAYESGDFDFHCLSE